VHGLVTVSATRANATPENGANDVPRDVVLGWKSGESVTSEDVYFGTSLDDVAAASRADPMGVLVSQGQSGDTYESVDLLDFSQTYWAAGPVRPPAAPASFTSTTSVLEGQWLPNDLTRLPTD
jgi:hypothetical protein